MALPQTLGPLTLVHQLGADAYTVSWLYRDADRGVLVAVRALADQWAQHPQARADFIEGTGPFQTVTSPQYAAVLGSGEAPDGTPYVVTPYAAPAGPPPGWAPTPTPTPTAGSRRHWPLVVGIGAAVLLLVGVGVAVAAALLAGTGTVRSTSAPASAPQPASGARPAVGQCRDLADSAVPQASDATPPVECSQPHTAQTYYVGTYRGAKPDSNFAGAVCQKQLGRGLGLSDAAAALTAYQVVFFQPDKDAWAAGARWFRCDLALLSGTHLLPLPATLVPHPLPASLQACLTQRGQPTPCDQDHLVRAVATFPVAGSTAPSPQQVQAQGRAKCPTGSVLFTGPSATEFTMGLRVGVCWAPEGHTGTAT